MIRFFPESAVVLLFCLVSAGPAAEVNFTVDCSATTGSLITRMMYGMNVARWDQQLFPTSSSQMLLDCDRDAIRKLKELDLGFLKYPGGNDADSYIWNSPANSIKDMDTTEFLHMAHACGAPGFFTVNFTQPPSLAAEWVRMISGPCAPAQAPYWEVGDEVWGSWAKSHTTGDGYGRKFRQFADAMRAENPNLKLAANLALSGAESTWTQDALRSLGDSFDIVTVTFFPLNPPDETDDALLTSPLAYRRMFGRLEAAVARALPNKPRPQYCLVGFNSTSGRPGPQTVHMVNGVFMAQMFGAMAETGTDMSCWWAFHNEWKPRGGDFGILTSDEKNQPYYTYWVLKLLSHNFHGRFLAAGREGAVEFYAAQPAGGGLTLLFVNTGKTETARPAVRIDNAQARNKWQTATVDVVDSSSLSIQRKAEWAARTVLADSGGNGSALQYISPVELAPYSVSVTRFK